MVKGQLNAIYRRLGASGRTDAVDRARHLELL
jgi:ATP/maltotriose-dependent transcriptional regulator MalT